MRTEAEVDEAAGRALHEALTADASAPARSIPRREPYPDVPMQTSGIKSARSASGNLAPSTPSFNSIENLQQAVDRLSSTEQMVLSLGSSLIGDAEIGKPRGLDPAKGYDRPLISGVHNLADLVRDLAMSIQQEVERIRSGL